MKILLESRPFYPSVGGMETVARQLAEAWTQRGHRIHVVTQTPLQGHEELGAFPITRRPSLRSWNRLLDDADLFLQSGVSLKTFPLAVWAQVPIVFIHHNMLPLSRGTVGLRNALKRVVARFGRNVAVSRAVADDLPAARTTVIPNPFVPQFRLEDHNEPASESHLLFVGRLVSVKGADVALRALSHLDPSYTLTICGDGAERTNLETLTGRLGIGSRVTFRGWVGHKELAEIAKQASIQLVPSRYEPFGIVALEAIAAGCPVVASRTGGLPEAVGPCGVLVEPDQPAALAQGVQEAVGQRRKFLEARQAHLSKFHIDTIADQYLDVFHTTLSGEDA
jgi:glycosyltransferase involved in cell wall biosynthesis